MDREEKIASFCDITSANPEQAAFFLEGCNWDLDNAVSSFLDEDSHGQSGPPEYDREPRDKVDEVEEAPPAIPSNPGAPPGGSSVRGGSSRAAGRSRNTAPSNSRIKTFSEMNRASQDDDDDDDDEPNEYYTGGEKSGMMVQDPKKGNRTSDVDAIFERARQFGAREGNIEDVEPSDSRKKGSFSGRGRTLTSSTEESEGGGQQSAPEPAGPTRYTITFWRNGFTVDNGPLRLLSDPANASFLASINRGECPRELAPKDRSSPVEVNLMKKDEDYTPPPEPRYMAFSGTGRTLGGNAGGSSSSEPPATTTSSRSNVTPHKGLVVDDSKPVTSIQLRLSDGTRMVSRFNLDHTVADIRAFIDASRPGNFNNGYQLQSMGFPPKPLLDPSQTIEAAGLVNSVVVQR